MDVLQECAAAFDRLLSYQYHIVIGRKGKLREFTITFEPGDFHHLAGLHKLRDNIRFQRGKREDIMREILAGKLTLDQARRSAFFGEMEARLKPLAELETFIDSNELIFRYNARANSFSAISADYLLQNSFDGVPVYLFLAQRTGTGVQVCRTFFPKTVQDYAEGQPRYTLLKKEKRNQMTGEIEVQYDRLTPKEPTEE